MKTNISSGKPVTPVFGTNDSPLINPQELSCPAQKSLFPALFAVAAIPVINLFATAIMQMQTGFRH